MRASNETTPTSPAPIWPYEPSSLEDEDPTTKRFPRTAADAFRNAEYGDPFCQPDFDPPENRNTWAGVLLAVAIALGLAAVIAHSLGVLKP